MKKSYYIRANSPLAYIIDALPIIAVAGIIILGGILMSSDLGVL